MCGPPSGRAITDPKEIEAHREAFFEERRLRTIYRNLIFHAARLSGASGCFRTCLVSQVPPVFLEGKQLCDTPVSSECDSESSDHYDWIDALARARLIRSRRTSDDISTAEFFGAQETPALTTNTSDSSEGEDWQPVLGWLEFLGCPTTGWKTPRGDPSA
eukprot:GHVU01036371.1.p1 GENE.GHVU01036371.1~~GHVU01036371.1.p1  ORF type:complete len:160 (+),score=13.25 GHVU01036371.1:254-733(+)